MKYKIQYCNSTKDKKYFTSSGRNGSGWAYVIALSDDPHPSKSGTKGLSSDSNDRYTYHLITARLLLSENKFLAETRRFYKISQCNIN